MKKFFGAMAILTVVLFVMAGAAFAADGYLMINGTKYQTPDEIKTVTSATASVVQDGDTIEVYGAVDLPIQPIDGSATELNRQYTWVLNASNVTIRGMDADATIYSSTQLLNGVEDGQQTIIVKGSGVTIRDLTVMPNYYTNAEPTYTNKTVTVTAQNFTIDNVVFAANTFADPAAAYGGALYFDARALGAQGGLKNILVQGVTFNAAYLTFDSATVTENVQITGNTFIAPDAPADSFYFVGSNSWLQPDSATKMGDITLQGNSFTNMPADFKAIVKQRMEGAFILLNNTTDDGLPIYDRVVFEAYRGSDFVSGGKGEVVVVENGTTYVVTIDDVADPSTVVTQETALQTPAVGTTVPAIDAADDLELKEPVLKTTPRSAASADVQSAKEELAAQLTGFTADDFDVNGLGQVFVKQETAVAAAGSLLVTGDKVATLPVFSTEVSRAGNFAAVAFVMQGADLHADTAANVKALKIKAADSALFMSYIASAADYRDGAFTILDAADAPAGAIDEQAVYKLVLFIKDNGDFDLDPTELAITDPVAIVSTTARTGDTHTGGSSSGCNAGLAMFALLLTAPLMFLKKRS